MQYHGFMLAIMLQQPGDLQQLTLGGLTSAGLAELLSGLSGLESLSVPGMAVAPPGGTLRCLSALTGLTGGCPSFCVEEVLARVSAVCSCAKAVSPSVLHTCVDADFYWVAVCCAALAIPHLIGAGDTDLTVRASCSPHPVVGMYDVAYHVLWPSALSIPLLAIITMPNTLHGKQAERMWRGLGSEPPPKPSSFWTCAAPK